MKALFLDDVRTLRIGDAPPLPGCGPHDVRIRVHTVGICGSDVHYYTHGRIGPYVVERPMILGHEASGTVIQLGSEVTHLKLGDRVCMEPGIPNPHSKAAKLGIYNVDPGVTFWATPPIDGCLVEEVVHPAAYTYRLPAQVSFAEGALVEPLSIGLQAASKAALKPGDTIVVIGAGTIGLMTALAALAGGASRAIVIDLSAEKLATAAGYPGVITVDGRNGSLRDTVAELTGGWGANAVFEASGSSKVFADLVACACPDGVAVLVGIPTEPVPFDVAAAQAKELRIETVFRYANMYERAIDLIASGRVNLKPLVSDTYAFDSAIEAFERAASGRGADVKLQISFGGETRRT